MKFATLILGGMDTQHVDMIRHQMPFQNLNLLYLQRHCRISFILSRSCVKIIFLLYFGVKTI